MSIRLLTEQFFNKASVEECSLDELRHVAKRHPYFAPVQFILVHKLKDINEESERQKGKAVLFYPDPLVFEAFIAEDNFSSPDSQTSLQENLPADTIPVATLSNQDMIIEFPETAMRQVEEPAPADNGISIKATAEDAIVETKPHEAVSEFSAKEVEESAIKAAEPEVPDTNGDVMPMMTDREKERPNLLPDPNSPLAELTFEPFHTVDYFASQGIKMLPDEGAKDKLGKGLKSFTEWLRTMKRLPGNPLPLENVAEKRVENMASHSVADSNIVTEAMAEVWAKQGNREKALAIYTKLSLLHPLKKTYFAAKIDHLKTS